VGGGCGVRERGHTDEQLGDLVDGAGAVFVGGGEAEKEKLSAHQGVNFVRFFSGDPPLCDFGSRSTKGFVMVFVLDEGGVRAYLTIFLWGPFLSEHEISGTFSV